MSFGFGRAKENDKCRGQVVTKVRAKEIFRVGVF